MSASLAYLYPLRYSDNFIRDVGQVNMPALDQMWSNQLGMGEWRYGQGEALRQGYLSQGTTVGRGLIFVRSPTTYATGNVSVDVMTTSDGSDNAVAGVVVNYHNVNSYYYALISRSGAVSLYKRETVNSTPTDTLLYQVIGTGLDPTVSHTLSVSYEYSSYYVYVDGKKYLTYIDSSNPLSPGPGGLITRFCTADFRKFFWYYDQPGAMDQRWTRFLVEDIPDSESLPVSTVKIPYGRGSRVQAGVGMGERTYHVKGTFLRGMGYLRPTIGMNTLANFRTAIEGMMRSNSPVCLLTPYVRTSGFIKNLKYPSSPHQTYSDFSFDLVEYYKNV
jgi:hypothetical protein